MAQSTTLSKPPVVFRTDPSQDPTALTDKAISELRTELTTLFETRFHALESVREEKFRALEQKTDLLHIGVQTQFAERDKRTEQLSIADKTAIAAALQAQKEAAGAQTESTSVAQNKMESQFAKLLDQQRELLNQSVATLDGKITEVSSRLDRGEGKTSVSDPAVAAGMKELSNMVGDLAKSRDTALGAAHTPWGIIFGAAAAVGVVVMLIFLIIARTGGAQ